MKGTIELNIKDVREIVGRHFGVPKGNVTLDLGPKQYLSRTDLFIKDDLMKVDMAKRCVTETPL